MNSTPGNRHEEDGYSCPHCMNRGYFMKLDDANGTFYEVSYPCKCDPIRKSIMRLKRSGLGDLVHDCTFEKWKTSAGWQKGLKEAAEEYAKKPKGWFFIGGQPGSGKTRLCSTICRELVMKSGKELQYMQWKDEAGKLKMPSNEPEKQQERLEQLKNAEVLYIDDLFKCGKKPDGSTQRPTSADIDLAFKIINYRYNNPDSITIISSELTPSDLIDVDEATGSRICERSNPIEIERDKSKNYRIQNLMKF